MASSSLNKDLLDLFDCPICMNFMYPPISQCPNGHHMCWLCKNRMNNKCPTCGKDIGDIRSLPLEKVADTILFPCKYQEMGCSGSFKYGLKQKHEKECGHRPYECPFPCSPRCTVTGDAKKLVSHLTDDHHVRVERSDTIDSPMIYLDSTLEVGSGTLVIHDCHSEHFILRRVHVGDEVICVYVIFMGEQQEAKKYLCKLEIGEEQNGKMTWEGTPRPIREEYTSNYCGLTFHTRALLCSSTSTISPTVKGSIRKKITIPELLPTFIGRPFCIHNANPKSF